MWRSLEEEHQGDMELHLEVGLVVIHELPSGTLFADAQKGIPDTAACSSWFNEAEEWPYFWATWPSSSVHSCFEAKKSQSCRSSGAWSLWPRGFSSKPETCIWCRGLQQGIPPGYFVWLLHWPEMQGSGRIKTSIFTVSFFSSQRHWAHLLFWTRHTHLLALLLSSKT